MKILKVKLKNIHSLKGEHDVDFANGILADAGLFVITGPTGSGKSTILDAITLALYNRIPRNGNTKISEKTIEDEGIILTKNTEDCYSEVTYQVGAEVYRSTWSISRARTNTLRPRKQELINEATGEIIVEGKETVPAKNEEIIGLNYDQFVQSLILAQGQFSKLLLAGKDDRNKLLEKITGSEIYRTIGMKVFERFASSKKAVEDQKLKMGEIVLLSEEQEAELQQFITDNEPKRLQLKAEQDLSKNLLEVKTKIQKLTAESLKNQEEWVEFVSRLELVEPEKQKLEKYIELAPFQNQYRAIRLQEKTNLEHQSRLEYLQGREITLKSEQQSLLVNVSKLLNDKILEIDFETKLNVFKQQILAFQAKELELKNQVDTFNRQLSDALKRLKNEQFEIEKSNQNKDFIHQEIVKINTFAERLNLSDSREIASKKSQLKDELNLVNVLIKNKNIYNLHTLQNQKLDTEILGLTTSIVDIAAQQKDLISRLEILKPKVEGQRKEVEQLKTERSLEEHRKHLFENEPCPLCGALEHPFAVAYEDRLLDALETQLEILLNELKSIESAQTKLSTANELAQKSVVAKQEEIQVNRSQFEKIEQEIRTACEQMSWNFDEHLEVWEQNLKQISTRLLELESLESQLRIQSILKEILSQLQERDQFQNELEQTTAERSKLYAGPNIETDVTTYLKNWTENNLNLTTCLEETTLKNKDLKVLNGELQVNLEKLLSDLREKLIHSLEEFEQQLLTENDAEVIRTKVNQLDIQKAKLEQDKERIQIELVENQGKDDLAQTQEQLVLLVKELENNIQIISESIGANRKQIETNNEAKSRLASSLATLELLNKDLDLWTTMNKLIGDSSGKRFSDFVQDLTLSQLIAFGNDRLKSFSDRYLLAVPQRNESTSLQVIDTHMGNTRRSVSSLSGGETFKLSLALAFGLSDLAAKNVNIESLFIDEGFGTLDPESLDQAITILEEMQHKNNKSIGIISHVGELKDRIGAKIKLVSTGGGYSRVVVE
jgi:exonuclease SbcC